MSKYVVRKMINGIEYELGPDAHLGYPEWNKIECERSFIWDTDDLAKIQNSLSTEIRLTSDVYVVPYIDKKLITLEAFDGLYDEYARAPNTQQTRDLIKYKTLDFLANEYFKGNYVTDPYDLKPIKEYKDIDVVIDEFDGVMKIFIKRKLHDNVE